MDSILIGTAISEHVIKEMSKPAVPLVKGAVTNDYFHQYSWLRD